MRSFILCTILKTGSSSLCNCTRSPLSANAHQPEGCWWGGWGCWWGRKFWSRHLSSSVVKHYFDTCHMGASLCYIEYKAMLIKTNILPSNPQIVDTNHCLKTLLEISLRVSDRISANIPILCILVDIECTKCRPCIRKGKENVQVWPHLICALPNTCKKLVYHQALYGGIFWWLQGNIYLFFLFDPPIKKEFQRTNVYKCDMLFSKTWILPFLIWTNFDCPVSGNEEQVKKKWSPANYGCKGCHVLTHLDCTDKVIIL